MDRIIFSLDRPQTYVPEDDLELLTLLSLSAMSWAQSCVPPPKAENIVLDSPEPSSLRVLISGRSYLPAPATDESLTPPSLNPGDQDVACVPLLPGRVHHLLLP